MTVAEIDTDPEEACAGRRRRRAELLNRVLDL